MGIKLHNYTYFPIVFATVSMAETNVLHMNVCTVLAPHIFKNFLREYGILAAKKPELEFPSIVF